MSARVRPSATASLPEIRSSFSSDAAGAALVTVAMNSSFPSGARRFGYAGDDRRPALHVARLVLRVLAGNAGRDLHAALLEVGHQLLLVLAAEAEAVRAHRGRLVADLGQQPRLVGGLVLAPHLPLAGVVVEGGLVDHGDAVLDRAHRLAHAAAAAGFHGRVERAVRHHVEDGAGARDPAEGAR